MPAEAVISLKRSDVALEPVVADGEASLACRTYKETSQQVWLLAHRVRKSVCE
jgi:hypothetical protein